MEKLGAFRPKEQGKLNVLGQWCRMLQAYRCASTAPTSGIANNHVVDAREAMGRIMEMDSIDRKVLRIPFENLKRHDPITAHLIYTDLKDVYPDRITEVKNMFGIGVGRRERARGL